MIPRIQQNTVGVPLAIQMKGSGAFDPTGLTKLEIHLRGPRGETWALAAAWRGDGTDGILERILEVGDLPQFGLHGMQGYAGGGGRELRSRVLDLDVYPNLLPPPLILRAQPLEAASSAPASTVA